MGGPCGNWRDGKLSTRRRAIRRYVLWPCCKPRWRAERRMWPTGRAKCRPRRQPGMAAPQDRPKMGVAGHAHRLGGGERLIPGSAGELPDGPGAGGGGTHTGERAGAPPPATEVRLLGRPGHRPRDAAGTPDIGRPPATSAAPESQRLARRNTGQWEEEPPMGHPAEAAAFVGFVGCATAREPVGTYCCRLRSSRSEEGRVREGTRDRKSVV